MNQYTFEIGDLSALTAGEKLAVVRAFGYASLGCMDLVHGRQSVGSLEPTESVTRIKTPWRVPSDVGIGSGSATLKIGTFYGELSLADTTMTQQLNNMERAQVNQGDYIVALCATGVSVTNQLLNARILPLPSGLTFQVGVASQTAQMGTYENPFSTADAFINFGSLVNVQGLAQGTPAIPQAPTTAIPVRGQSITTNKASR